MDVPTDCLWCGAALEMPLQALNRCPECGRGNRKDDLVTYRTRRPSAQRLESALKGVALLAIGGGAIAAMLNVMKLRHHGELIVPILGPIVGGMMLWYISGFITQRRSARFPTLLGLTLFIAPLLVALVIGFGATKLPLAMRVTLLVAVAFGGGVFMLRSWRRSRD